MPILSISSDAVGVFNSGFGQVFPDARPMRARVTERSRLLDHPLENGQIVTDYSIVMPIEIDYVVLVQAEFYRDTYQEIRNFYLNKELLTVQTNTANYPNMVIAEMPHEEKPELFDALPITIRFRQIQLVPNPATYAPEDPTQENTEVLGQQNSYGISGVQTSDGVQTIDFDPNSLSYSSVPPQISGVQTMNGVQSIPLPQTDGATVTGVQTITSNQTIGAAFR